MAKNFTKWAFGDHVAIHTENKTFKQLVEKQLKTVTFSNEYFDKKGKAFAWDAYISPTELITVSKLDKTVKANVVDKSTVKAITKTNKKTASKKTKVTPKAQTVKNNTKDTKIGTQKSTKTKVQKPAKTTTKQSNEVPYIRTKSIIKPKTF